MINDGMAFNAVFNIISVIYVDIATVCVTIHKFRELHLPVGYFASYSIQATGWFPTKRCITNAQQKEK